MNRNKGDVGYPKKLLKQKEKYHTNQTYRINQIQYNKQKRLEDKLLVIKYYTHNKNCCNYCGIPILEVLTVDHIKGKGRQHRINNNIISMWLWLRLKKFPKGYQILCFNCNYLKYIGSLTLL